MLPPCAEVNAPEPQEALSVAQEHIGVLELNLMHAGRLLVSQQELLEGLHVSPATCVAIGTSDVGRCSESGWSADICKEWQLGNVVQGLGDISGKLEEDTIRSQIEVLKKRLVSITKMRLRAKVPAGE